MGQKVNPNGLRYGINKTWNSFWFADKKQIAKNIKEDNEIRKYIFSNNKNGAVAHIQIERAGDTVTVNIGTGKPGVLIGSKGENAELIRKQLEKISSAKRVIVNIKEIKNIDLDAQLVADGIAAQLEKRVQFRRAMKSAMQKVMRAGAVGVKVMVGGRLDGAEIARSEHYHEGLLPLHTLRANIDYAFSEAQTTFGVLGVKVWIYKGDILGKVNMAEQQDKGGN